MSLKTPIAAFAAFLIFSAVLLAHQVTYKGTVIAVEKSIVKVATVDEKTKKPLTINFKVDKDTKILRGDKLTTLAEARIDKNEKIAVTVDHDLDEDLALVIRLDPKK